MFLDLLSVYIFCSSSIFCVLVMMEHDYSRHSLWRNIHEVTFDGVRYFIGWPWYIVKFIGCVLLGISRTILEFI